MKEYYSENQEFNEILDLGFLMNIRNTDIQWFERSEVCAIFNISKDKLDSLISRLVKIAKRLGFKKAVDKCFDDGDASVLGMYLLCYYNENSENELFKKYKPLFAEQGLNFAIKLIGNLPSERTDNRNRHRGTIPGIDYEDLMIMSSTKKIPSELKQMKEVEDTSHLFYKKKVVITGTFEKFPFREEMAKLLHEVGADVNSSISKKTDYVIVGESAGPKKLEKIENLGIPTISEVEFLKLFNL